MSNSLQLLVRAHNGDSVAFDALYQRYERPLFSFIFRIIGNRNDAEEIFQSVFLNILESKPSSSDEEHFTRWIFQIARNIALNHLRTRARKNTAFQHLTTTPSHSVSLDDAYVEHEAQFRLSTEVNALPAEQRELFKLKSLGLSVEEIAQTLSIPSGTVKSRTHALIQMLKEVFRS